MNFAMDKFTDDELTRGTELAEYICANFKAITDGPEVNHIKRFVLNIISDDGELLDEQFAFIEKDMTDSYCRDLWICWTEFDGELDEWWITADNC